MSDERTSNDPVTPDEETAETLDNQASAEMSGDESAQTDAGAKTAAGDRADDPAGQLQTLRDQLLRKVAEFENYRRRTDEEKAALIRYGNENLIIQLLPILDDLDRSLKAGREHPNFDTFYKGVEILRSKFVKVLEHKGLKPIEAKGQPFDVDLHEAMLQMPAPGAEPGTVLDEVEVGYTLHDRVIRHAKVIVAGESEGTAIA